VQPGVSSISSNFKATSDIYIFKVGPYTHQKREKEKGIYIERMKY
jgi:hypothetical protein